jgi:hypothetical protein
MYFSLTTVIQIKKGSTTKMYNSFVHLVEWFTLFTFLIYLSNSFMKLYKRDRFCEQHYYRFCQMKK